MARYVGLWYGGSNYAAPDPERDAEPFDSIAQASRVLASRVDNEDGRTPCADEGGPELHLYIGEYSENGPDVVLGVGPRGAIRREAC